MPATITRSVTVDRPIGPVGRYLCEFGNSAAWVAHNQSCERLDDGPVRIGARYRTVARVGPLVETIEQQVVELDHGRHLVVEGHSQYLRTRGELTCTSTTTGGTQVVYTARVELVGRARLGNRALAPFLGLVADQGAEQLRRTLLEVVRPAVRGPRDAPSLVLRQHQSVRRTS